MKKIAFICLVLSVFFYIDTMYGQVTIGNSEPPLPGALLQVQNLPSTQGGLTNSNKGLMLPRVKLTDVNNLFPMLPAGYNKQEQDIAYSGLLVFNINEALPNSLGIGVYIWNGTKWTNLSETPQQ